MPCCSDGWENVSEADTADAVNVAHFRKSKKPATRLTGQVKAQHRFFFDSSSAFCSQFAIVLNTACSFSGVGAHSLKSLVDAVKIMVLEVSDV